MLNGLRLDCSNGKIKLSVNERRVLTINGEASLDLTMRELEKLAFDCWVFQMEMEMEHSEYECNAKSLFLECLQKEYQQGKLEHLF